MKRLQDRFKPPMPDREKGDRAAKGLTPPFHKKGDDVKKYRSFKDIRKNSVTHIER